MNSRFPGRRADVACPYCFMSQSIYLDTEGLDVYYCNDEEGGCGKPFVVDVKLFLRCEVFEMKPVGCSGKGGSAG